MNRLQSGQPARRGVIGTAFVALAFASTLAAETFERPPVFQAAAVLTPELAAGAEHQVDSRVANDGFMNMYRVQSRFGTFEATSTAELKIRVREIYAMAQMSAIESSDVFVDAVKNAGADVVRGVANVITDPGGALTGAISGVGKLFGRAGAALSGEPRSESEGSKLEDAVGLSSKKREYAADFGVDVYSSNQAMQAQLDRIARAGYFGGLGTGLTIGAVTGPILTATSGVDLMNDVFRSTPPSDLREMNRKKLGRMGVPADTIDLFIANRHFSPRQQTLLVAALENMPGVDGRGNFVRFAVTTEEEDLARFRQRQAQMYAGYHASVEPITAFVAFGRLVGARTASDKVVFNVPLDHLAWTKGIAELMRWANGQIRGGGASGERGELWVTGTVSALAKKNLTGLGWRTHAGASHLVPGG